MIVEYEEIINYLLGQKLICTDRIVENDLVIIDVSRRNCNFKVISEDGPCYFLKQDIRDRGEGDLKFATIAHEAKVYKAFESIYVDKRFCHYLPRYYTFDSKERLLVLEAITGSMNLVDYHFRRGRFPSLIAKELGKALARLHGISEAEKERIEETLGVPRNPPWVFFFPEPDQWMYLNSSSANIELVRIFQKSTDLCRLFDELRAQWKTDVLIHSDLKWDNCLVASSSTSRSKSRVKIVDWELACMGDPCWDLGTVFSQYLNFWLSSIPISGETPPDQFLAFARFPLSKMHLSIRSFWNAYVRHLEIAPNEIESWLLRATRYAGVRLVQTAFEQLQNEAGITNRAICLLQLCSNILTRPMEAAVQLLGLPLPQELYNERQLC